MQVRVVDARHQHPPGEVDHLGARPDSSRTPADGADVRDRPVADGDRLDVVAGHGHHPPAGEDDVGRWHGGTVRDAGFGVVRCGYPGSPCCRTAGTRAIRIARETERRAGARARRAGGDRAAGDRRADRPHPAHGGGRARVPGRRWRASRSGRCSRPTGCAAPRSCRPGWAGARVDLLLDTGGEATLWLGGEPVAGAELRPADAARRRRPLVERREGGERVPFELELACNDLFGFGEAGQGAAATFALRALRARALRRGGVGRVARPRRARARWSAIPASIPPGRGCCSPSCTRSRSTATAARLARLLAHRSRRPAPDDARSATRTSTRRGCGRSRRPGASSCARRPAQLRLMDAYPEHRFAHSQAQHYAWLAERAPGAVRARAGGGRARAVDPGRRDVGGARLQPALRASRWRASSCTASASSSSELGRRCTELWLPDVFGYAAQLPQLMRLGGPRPLPHAEAVLEPLHVAGEPHVHLAGARRQRGAHALPARGHLQRRGDRARAARRRPRAYKDHPRSRHSLLVFGHGDGGGGPTAEMLERLRRAARPRRDAAGRAAPAGRRSSTDLAEEAQDLRTVVGELYFEYHRGTYTSQAAVKRGNRRGERALQDAETLDALLRRRRRQAGARPAVARAAAQPVPRHPARLEHHRGLRARPGGPRRGGRGRRRGGRRRACSGRAGEVPVAVGGPARRAVVARPDGRLALAELPGVRRGPGRGAGRAR